MGDKTTIGWTEATWNPVVGCTRVSRGCDHCYAFALHDKRYAANVVFAKTWSGLHEEGTRQLRQFESWSMWAERVGRPVEGWGARARALGLKPPYPAQYDTPFSAVQLMPQRLDQPLRWRKPRRIFVNSVSDLFHPDVPDEFIDRAFAAMMLATWHTFQVLTKRPARMRAYMADVTFERLRQRMNENVYGGEHGPGAYSLTSTVVRTLKVAFRNRYKDDPARVAVLIGRSDTTLPLPNVWLGVSVEDQERADERIPLLLRTPAAVRFISGEPLLGPIDVTPYIGTASPDGSRERTCLGCGWPRGRDQLRQIHVMPPPAAYPQPELNHDFEPGLDWVIVGGESGARPRPMDHEWVRAIREACRAAGVAYFGKQDVSPGSTKRALPGDLGDQEFPA